MIVDPSIPQPEPLQTPGVKTSAQIVDHLDKVLASQPPEVQAAVDHAHNVMGMQSPVQAPPASPIVSANVPSDVQPLSVPSPQAASAAMPAPLASSAPVGGPSVGSDEMGTPAAPKPLGAPASPHMAELERLHNTGSGISQIKNPFLRGLATVGDVAASGFLPQFGQFIPGTSAHHQQLIGSEENQLGQEQKAAKSAADVANVQAEVPLRGAQASLASAQASALPSEMDLRAAETKNYLSEAEARKNPDLQIVSHPVIDPDDQSKTPRTGYFNKKTGAMTYGPEMGAAPVAESNKPTVEKMDNGEVIAVHYDPATKKSSNEVIYHGDPKVETDIKQIEVGGKPHQVLFNKKTGAQIKDLGETGEKPPTVNMNQGTWSIQEDAEGKPIEYNSKTGETRAVAAGGIQKAGTKEKADAKLAPGKDAMAYADQYLNGSKFTGSGDEALLEKFFELAKPSSGFRMSQPQIDLLQHSRGYLGTAKAIGHHALTGTWFDDNQRKEIVDTMKQIVNSKASSQGGTPAHQGGNDPLGVL